MDWLAGFKTAIAYMEEHLLENIGTQDVADAVHLSPFYFQRCFKIVTGYTVGEYVRNRRLYQAGLDILCGGRDEGKVIELAFRYGYDTPEGFTKAFTRFHGLSPVQLRFQPHRIKVFLPLVVEISVKGGDKMDFTLEKREALKMIGFERTFAFETSYQEIPKFWDEFCRRFCAPDTAGSPEEEALRQTVAECAVGEFGVCVENGADTESFRYFIAGAYQGGATPEGMTVMEIPACEWAKFPCTGAMPDALQTVNTRIFREWLPGNKMFEQAFPLNIEWYSNGDTASETYKSAIWIPVKRLA